MENMHNVMSELSRLGGQQCLLHGVDVTRIDPDAVRHAIVHMMPNIQFIDGISVHHDSVKITCQDGSVYVYKVREHPDACIQSGVAIMVGWLVQYGNFHCLVRIGQLTSDALRDVTLLAVGCILERETRLKDDLEQHILAFSGTVLNAIPYTIQTRKLHPLPKHIVATVVTWTGNSLNGRTVRVPVAMNNKTHTLKRNILKALQVDTTTHDIVHGYDVKPFSLDDDNAILVTDKHLVEYPLCILPLNDVVNGIGRVVMHWDGKTLKTVGHRHVMVEHSPIDNMTFFNPTLGIFSFPSTLSSGYQTVCENGMTIADVFRKYHRLPVPVDKSAFLRHHMDDIVDYLTHTGHRTRHVWNLCQHYDLQDQFIASVRRTIQRRDTSNIFDHLHDSDFLRAVDLICVLGGHQMVAQKVQRFLHAIDRYRGCDELPKSLKVWPAHSPKVHLYAYWSYGASDQNPRE